MTVVTDELLKDLIEVRDECVKEGENGEAPNAEYNQGWIDALRYAINHLERFENE